jgi:biopolymer transport protein ExbD
MVNSGDVEVLQSDKNISLPDSVAEQRPDITLLVKINADDIIVQGRSVAKVADVLAQNEDAIAELDKELQYLASRKPLLTEEEQKNGHSVTIMGDKNVSYTLLKRVMTTCAQADYRDISLAVNALPAMNDAEFIQSQSASSSVLGEG